MTAAHAQRGQVLPLVAICLAVLMGFAGLAVDVGYWSYQQRQQQSATDAAAIGGAQQQLYSGCASAAAATAAKADAANNGFTNGSNNVAITVQTPPSSGPFSSTACAVSVQITKTKVAAFFARLFGQANGVTDSTSAVAILSANGSGCMYFLSRTSQSVINGDNVQAPTCGMLINDTAVFNGSTVNALNIGYAGGTPVENGGTFSKASPSPMLPVADPCPEIAGCAYLAANPPPSSGCTSYNANGLTGGSMTPGCYSNVNINGSHITMAPGTYVFNGPTSFNGSNISGTGVTIYVTANGTPPNFNGNSVSLTPPSSGNLNGVLYYQVPANTSAPNFNGTTMNLQGLLYAPTANGVVFNGASGSYLVLVFGSVSFNGSSQFDFGSPPANASLIREAVLAE